ncbi:MAG: gas vesicle protein [Thermoguttaceae bacterium]|jgi:hypothetical protein
MAHAQAITQSTQSQGLPEVLERVLDKGVVIMGDIMIKLCNVELLSIHIRLLVCSVDKAREMGVAWWEPAVKPNHAVPPPHSPLMSKSAAETMPGAAGEDDLKFQQTMRTLETGPTDPSLIGRRSATGHSL